MPLHVDQQPPSTATAPRTRREVWQDLLAALRPDVVHQVADMGAAPQHWLGPPGHARGARGSPASYQALLLNPQSWNGWTVLHLGVSATLLWLCTLLLLPHNTFDSSPSYQLFAALAPERAWALLFGVGAFAGFAGAATDRPLFRVGSCALLSSLHTLIAFCMLLSNPLSTGSGTYCVLALLALMRLVAGR